MDQEEEFQRQPSAPCLLEQLHEQLALTRDLVGCLRSHLQCNEIPVVPMVCEANQKPQVLVRRPPLAGDLDKFCVPDSRVLRNGRPFVPMNLQSSEESRALFRIPAAELLFRRRGERQLVRAPTELFEERVSKEEPAYLIGVRRALVEVHILRDEL